MLPRKREASSRLKVDRPDVLVPNCLYQLLIVLVETVEVGLHVDGPHVLVLELLAARVVEADGRGPVKANLPNNFAHERDLYVGPA